MNRFFKIIFRKEAGYRKAPDRPPELTITQACVEGMAECMSQERIIQHEGVCYLLGLTTGINTLAVSAIRPKAITSKGSFRVEKLHMAEVVRCAARVGLQVVGQAHTHPGEAYHSEGDVEGAKIAYSGFCSLVLPDYGDRLPSLDGIAAYIFKAPDGFIELVPNSIHIVGKVAK